MSHSQFLAASPLLGGGFAPHVPGHGLVQRQSLAARRQRRYLDLRSWDIAVLGYCLLSRTDCQQVRRHQLGTEKPTERMTRCVFGDLSFELPSSMAGGTRIVRPPPSSVWFVFEDSGRFVQILLSGPNQDTQRILYVSFRCTLACSHYTNTGVSAFTRPATAPNVSDDCSRANNGSAQHHLHHGR